MGLKSGRTRSSLRNVQVGYAIPDSGVSRWTYDTNDFSGSTLTDVWGDNDGTINGVTMEQAGLSTTYDSGESGSFDGTDDNVTTSLTPNNYPSTLAGWIDIQDGTGLTQFFGTNNYESGNDSALSVGQNNGNYFAELKDDGNNVNISPQSVTTGVQHLAVVATSTDLILYKDGSEIGSTTHSISQVTTVESFVMGVESDFGSSLTGTYLDGGLDDVRVYDKGLSATEVSDLYNTGSI